MFCAFTNAYVDPNPVSLTIAGWTGGPYSHVELVFSNGDSFSSDFRDGGVRIAKGIDFSSPVWECVEVKPNSEPAIRKWAEKQCGKPFDWRYILAFVCPWVKVGAPKSWGCAECVCAALQQDGTIDGQVDARRISPNELYDILTGNTVRYMSRGKKR